MTAAAVALIAFTLAGCQYLFGLSPMPPIGPIGSFDPDAFESFAPELLPSPQAVLTSGTASVTIDGETTKLDRLVGNGAIYDEFGSQATWTDGEGLYVRFYGDADIGAGPGYVSLDRIRDGTHWTTIDPSGCVLMVSKSDTSGIAGTASCKDLRWSDAMSGFAMPYQQFVEGQPAFDAEISFEAAP